MASIGISEFTFGYAFLYEQTHRNWGGLTAAPILPNLYQEAQLGWDAHLPIMGTDFYYQFKVNDYLSRGNSMYIRDGLYSSAYYRIALHRRDGNRQHRRLRYHARSNRNTFYVSPELHGIEEFNRAFLSRQMTERTRLIPLRECDDIWDSEQHYVTYQAGRRPFIQHSEAGRHEHSILGRELAGHYGETRDTWREVDTGFAVDVFRRTQENVRELIHREGGSAGPIDGLLDFHPERERRFEALDSAAQLLSAFFGLTLVVVGERKT